VKKPVPEILSKREKEIFGSSASAQQASRPKANFKHDARESLGGETVIDDDS